MDNKGIGICLKKRFNNIATDENSNPFKSTCINVPFIYLINYY